MNGDKIIGGINSMHEYQLINNHYVLSLGGHLYFIDTGSPKSISKQGFVEVDGKRYSANLISESELIIWRKLIGAEIDGLIGNDVLSKTSLTIYKDGHLEFAGHDASSESRICQINYQEHSPVTLPCLLKDGREAVAIIDTGAMLYYGKYPKFFSRNDFVGEFDDYNPCLKYMHSKFYKQTINIAGKTIDVSLGDNIDVNRTALSDPNFAAIINLTELFEEYVVIDFKNRRFIFR